MNTTAGARSSGAPSLGQMFQQFVPRRSKALKRLLVFSALPQRAKAAVLIKGGARTHEILVRLLFVVYSTLALLLSQPLTEADQQGIGQKAEEVAKETTTAVEKAGSVAADAAKDVWQRIDAARLKNRTPDELVAWVIVGVLVGGVAGMMTSFKPTGSGRLGRLALGLAGAFLGGIIVNVLKVDFGWGPVLIRYEELFFSLVGAILIVLVGKIISSRMKKKGTA